MFYAGLVDCIISYDSDMVVYGVPTIRNWNNGYGDFIPYNTISRIAASKNKSLADYVIDSMQECGCDYFKGTHKAMPEGNFGYTDQNTAIYRQLFRNILQASYQYFYAPIIDLETGYVHCLRNVPALEQKFGSNVLAHYTFGTFDHIGYTPVPDH